MNIFINPLVVFFLTWFSVLVLYNARWSDILVVDSNFMVVFVSFYILLPFLLGFIASYLIPIKRGFNHGIKRLPILRQIRLKYLTYFFVFLTILEIIIFKGFPFIWLLTGDSRGYADYGLPTLHGLINAVHLALITVFFYLAVKKQASWFFFFILIFWCVMMFSRFLIMVAIVQCLFLYFMTVSVRPRKIFSILIFVFALVYFFGVIGSLRSGIDDTAKFFGVNENFPSFLPVVFIWVYIYLVSPINNLASWYGYTAYDFTFPSVFATLLPSVLRNVLYGEVDEKSLPLVHETFNMSTGLAPAFADAGLPGMIVFVAFIGFIGGLSWRLSKGLTNYFSLSVILQCIFYLVFFNPLFSLPVLFQFFVFKFLIRYEVSSNGLKDGLRG